MPVTPEIWLAEVTVNLTTTNSQTRPRITQLANGNILVVWDSTDDSGVGGAAGIDLIGQIFDPLGVPVGVEFRVNSVFTGNDELDVDIAALPNGGFVAVYEDFNSVDDTRSIRLVERGANGFTVPFNQTVISDGTNDANPTFFNPVVAVSSATSVLVVWEEAEVGAGQSQIAGRVYNPETDTYGDVINLINTPGTNSVPVVTALTNGNYVVACATVEGGDQVISYRIVNSAGINVVSVTQVASTVGDSLNDLEPTVTALTGGGFVLAWTSVDAEESNVHAQIVDAAGLPRPLFTISGGGIDIVNQPSVVAMAGGGFIVFFDDDLNNELRGLRYNSAGDPLGDEFSFAATDRTFDEIDAVLLGDGRVAVTFQQANGEISMVILDTRDAPNATAVYSPNHSIGTIGDDVFTANADRNYGHDGDDTITEGGGLTPHSIYGGNGDDTVSIFGVDGAEDVDGGSGTNRLIGAKMSDGTVYDLAAGTVTDGAIIQSVIGFQVVTGSEADEAFIGTDGTNIMLGGAGNDTLNGGLGADTVHGGTGDDLIFVNQQGDLIVEFAGEGTLDRIAASASYSLGGGNTLFSDFEQLQTTASGGTTAINLTGNALAQRIFGNAGANVLNDGGFGAADTLTGSLGNDTYIVNNTGTLIVEGSGQGTNDRVASSVSFVLAADDDIERLTTTSSGAVNAINLTGNVLAQSIFGNAGNNVLHTGGGGVSDTLTGGAGNDTYRVFTRGDIITETAGNGTADRVTAAATFALAADDDIEIMTTNGSTGTAAINLTGNAVAQAITGNAGANVLSDGGGAGADTLAGLGGNDMYLVRNLGTLITETVGQGTNDRVAAGVSFALAADDSIEVMTTISAAAVTAINLTGNGVAQAITGNAGENVLSGLGGPDTLTGGAGADTFVFAAATVAGNIDTVTDFNIAADTIFLENLFFTGLPGGLLAAAAFRASLTGQAADATDRILYETDTGNLFFDADGTGAGGRVRFAVVDIGLAMTQTDFFVI